ncbi:MAG: conjugal transfer protein [Caulobacter sp.]|nr:conjugal transfer protein [Caulobacter sp.]
MVLTLSQALALAAACAPTIAPQTLLSVAKVESGLDPLAIGVNGRPRLSVRAATPAQAARKAAGLIAAGRSLDLGLAQINSNNLGRLGLSVEAAFDPCANLAAAAQVLQAGYRRGRPQIVGEQPALRTALSLYNTGAVSRGLKNGYVAKVVGAANQVVPAIAVVQAAPLAPSEPLAPSPPAPPAWDVFGQSASPSSFFIRVSTPSLGDSQ